MKIVCRLPSACMAGCAWPVAQVAAFIESKLTAADLVDIIVFYDDSLVCDLLLSPKLGFPSSVGHAGVHGVTIRDLCKGKSLVRPVSV